MTCHLFLHPSVIDEEINKFSNSSQSKTSILGQPSRMLDNGQTSSTLNSDTDFTNENINQIKNIIEVKVTIFLHLVQNYNPNPSEILKRLHFRSFNNYFVTIQSNRLKHLNKC